MENKTELKNWFSVFLLNLNWHYINWLKQFSPNIQTLILPTCPEHNVWTVSELERERERERERRESEGERGGGKRREID